MIVIEFMINLDLDHEGTFMPDDFTFNVHSANPVGFYNIKGLLDSYLNFRANKNNA